MLAPAVKIEGTKLAQGSKVQSIFESLGIFTIGCRGGCIDKGYSVGCTPIK